MSKTGLRHFPDRYVDSVRQLAGTRAMRIQPGIDWAAAVTGTPTNLSSLREEGFDDAVLDKAGVNDLILAARGADKQAIESALDAGDAATFAAEQAQGTAEAKPARSLASALKRQPGSNVAVISVPGPYATLEAHKALTAGLDVLLFSDNVPLDSEIELKERATALGRLVMGPGAGTAVLGGTGLGFANVVRSGRVGVVAAAGTGAQEVMSLLDRFGAGVSAVVGLGGRDLSEAVDGRMAKQAIAMLREDPATEVILLVSKPPAAEVAQAVLDLVGDTPFVAALIGQPDRSPVCSTLERAVLATLDHLALPRPDLVRDLPDQVARAIGRLPTTRRAVRGLYSGGTLCYEAQVILSKLVGPVYSNAPLDKAFGPPFVEGTHICLDLGEEEYTAGRPHPMIDPEARIELLREHGADPDVAVIVLDVVLGYGSHNDPAGALAPVCAAVSRSGGPAIVAYCLGTERDPQGLARQRQRLLDAGCIVTETAARAAYVAAAVAFREPLIARR